MRILIIGSGGREHALVWKLKQSPHCTAIYSWPGNVATLSLAQSLPIASDATFDVVAAAALSNNIDLAIIGPESYLSQGLTDTLQKFGIKVFGPSQKASQIESSKVFAKKLMTDASIPTAAYEIVQTPNQCREASMRLLTRDGGVVLKASGLAQGKGVFVCRSESELNAGIARLYSDIVGDASRLVLVEEMLFGREASFFCFIGHGQISKIGFAVDYKRLLTGDKGPNTGGMGAYSPVPWLPIDAGDQIEARVVVPLLSTLQKSSISFCGCLYVGLMWSDQGPSVLEFNARLGDPETQVLVVSDQSDWLPLIASKVGVELQRRTEIAPRKSVIGTVLASTGYPFGEIPDIDAVIPWNEINRNVDGSTIFIGQCTPSKAGIKTEFGRNFLIAGSGKSFHYARSRVTQQVERIKHFWPGAQSRSDIGLSVIQYEEAILSTSNYVPIILGSSSPRRKELLGNLGLDFTVIKPETEEKPKPGELPSDYVLRNAREKNEWICLRVSKLHPSGAIVISADTIVVIDDKILEKPLNATDAQNMLILLSGRRHSVLTAVKISLVSDESPIKSQEFVISTDVTIKPLNASEIEGYIETGEPFDKAGGYAAQGIGSFMVQEISGSYSNVVGLPLAELAQCLQSDFGVPLWRDR